MAEITFETLEQAKKESEAQTELEEIREALRGKTVFITPYAHCDWCWSHSRDWHYIRYRTSLDEILDLMKENPEFTWYMDSWITHILPYMKARPERIQELGEAIRRGQMAICGDYSNVRINMVAEEALVRNIIYGRRDIREWFPEADFSVNGSYVDVSLGGPQTPQIMRKGGYEFYRAQRPFQVLAWKGIPHDFLWKGLDGSELICWWGSYGGWWTKELAELDFKGDWDEAVKWIWQNELKDVCDSNSGDVVITAHGSDDSRPLRAHNDNQWIDLPGIIERWNARETSTLRFGTPPMAFRQMKEQKEKLAVVTGTIDPCDVPYNCAYCGERSLLQTRIGGAEALVRAEKWMTAASQVGARAYEHLEEEWRENLKISAHASQDTFTWDYDQFKRWGEEARMSADRKMEMAMDAIAGCMDAPENTIAVLFNSHDKEVRRAVTLTVVADRFDTLKLYDGLGREVPYQIEKPIYYGWIWECRVRCVVTLPPLGYTCIRAEGADVSAKNCGPEVLERMLPLMDQPLEECFNIDNGKFVFSFDHGDLVSIQKKESGEFLQKKGSTPWNRVEFRRCDDEIGIMQNGPVREIHAVKWNRWVAKMNGPLVWEVELVGSEGFAEYRQTITIEQNSGRIDIKTEVDWNHVGFLVASIPMPEKAPVYGGVAFGVEYKDIEKEQYQPQEENLDRLDELDLHRFRKGLFYAKNVAFYRADGGTAALSNWKGDRFFLKDNDRGQLDYMLINSLNRGKQGWRELVAEESLGGSGRHCFQYSVMLYDREVPAEQVLSDAAALREEIVTRRVYGKFGKATLPAQGSFLQVEDAGVVVSALYQEGEDVILRVYDTAGGERRQVEIDLPFSPLRAMAQDFIGTPDASKAVTVGEKKVCVEICPFEIVTLRLKGKLHDDRIG